MAGFASDKVKFNLVSTDNAGRGSTIEVDAGTTIGQWFNDTYGLNNADKYTIQLNGGVNAVKKDTVLRNGDRVFVFASKLAAGC